AGFEMYDGIKVLAQALQQAGSADPAAIRDALAKGIFTSILGEIRFDDNHQAHNGVLLLKVRNGALEVEGLSGT
ncbi:MAG: ABC transporter substrate-binding protein, partial [Rhodospirillales bacterium]|nr:ABC transporter substrate-binding protein [Rhodospirillales bacterium]